MAVYRYRGQGIGLFRDWCKGPWLLRDAAAKGQGCRQGSGLLTDTGAKGRCCLEIVVPSAMAVYRYWA